MADTLITLSIIVILSVLIVGLYFSYNNIFKIYLVKSDLQNSNTISLYKMTSTIKSASNIVESKTINSQNYTTSINTLILELPSVDNNQNIIPNTYDYLVYFLDSTNLKSSQEAAAGSSRESGIYLIGENINNIIFSYNKNIISQADKVEITLTAVKEIKQISQKLISHSQAKLRNK